MASLKDQPIDIPEFERMWIEIESLWRDIESHEMEWGSSPDVATLVQYRKLKEIKYRLFNQLL